MASGILHIPQAGASVQRQRHERVSQVMGVEAVGLVGYSDLRQPS
jgi:hypothetical protein